LSATKETIESHSKATGSSNFRTAYTFNENVQLFAQLNNLFEAEYATLGVLAEVEIELQEAPDAEDP
jgi:outer membrane receptor protein involved in Fe transport